MENTVKDEELKKVSGGADEEEPEGPVCHGYLVGDDCLACGVCAEITGSKPSAPAQIVICSQSDRGERK